MKTLKFKKAILGLLILIAISTVGYYIKTIFFYSGEIIVLKGTNVYHRQDCEIIKKASLEKLVFYKSAYESAQKDNRPCKSCNPPQITKEEEALILKSKEEENQKKQADSKLWTSSDFSKMVEERIEKKSESEKEKKKELLKSIKILGNSSESNYGVHKITCSVKNGNSIDCKVIVQAIYYDSNNNIINTKESSDYDGNITANGIKGFTIRNSDNVSKINRYELNIEIKS